MKNILGTQEDLILYNKAGNLVYEFTTDSKGYSWETTRDEKGNQLTFKDSDGYSWEQTWSKNGNCLTFKDSNGFWWERTYDDHGNVLTYRDTTGIERGFDIQEFTMEQLVEKIGNFKLIK